MVVMSVNASQCLSKSGRKVGRVSATPSNGRSPIFDPRSQLSLRSSVDKQLQEVTSRSHDNYIQLKPFKGKPGKRFKVAIHLGSETIEENFEL